MDDTAHAQVGKGDAFLDVTRSLSGRTWRLRSADAALTRRHQLALGLPEPLARALAARGVADGEGEIFLAPTLKAQFPDPSSFADMDLAAATLIDALQDGRSMTVFADYDVDGAASAAQLVRWFRAMGLELPIYVPDRILEGYGPSPATFRRLKADGVDLVITVDCGAAAHDALACAAEIGLSVVVIDHHLMREGAAPAVAALVNPNRPDCRSGQGHLAAAGVTFVLLAALNREARRRGLFAEREEPRLTQWLDLAAMGAICDVTRLTGFNRALTAQGLRVMSGWRNPGLKALLATAQAKEDVASTFHAGFILGPRINAGGRIGRADLGARLLSTDDPAEAAELAAELDALNVERKTIEQGIIEDAIRRVEQETNLAQAPMILIAGDDWAPGVIGIVAGRLRERYRKPVVVVAIDRAADVGRGSGRSQPGVNLGRAVQAAYDAGLLLAGGGHAMAAGLTVRPADLPELRAFLCAQLAGEAIEAEGLDGLEIDAALTAQACDRPLFDAFQALAPFGPGNPEPTFVATDVRIERAMTMRGGHVRCTLTDAYGGRLKAVAWRCEDTEVGRRLMAEGGLVHVAGRLRADDWQGRAGVQFEIDDIADPRRVTP